MSEAVKTIEYCNQEKLDIEDTLIKLNKDNTTTLSDKKNLCCSSSESVQDEE